MATLTQSDLHLPDALQSVPASLLTEASNPPTDPPTIKRVGAYFHATDESVWFSVNGTLDQAQHVIDRDVAALLAERFPVPGDEPVVEVVPEPAVIEPAASVPPASPIPTEPAKPARGRRGHQQG